MHTIVHYSKAPNREAADEQAISDIIDYFGPERMNAVELLIDRATKAMTAEHIQSLNCAFGFAGITGYPFHAFMRRYALTAYRAWMHSEPDPVPTDEAGFAI